MSTYEDDFIGAGRTSFTKSLPNHLIPSSMNVSFNKIDQGYRSKPVPFSEVTARLLKQEVACAFNSQDPLKYIVNPDYIPLWGNEAKRFICAIEAYITSDNPIIPLSELIKGISFRDYASTLKKIRTACLTRRFSATPNQDDGLEDFVPKNYQTMEDIGDIFNYKYWFRWEEPEPEDWKHALLPLDEPSDDIKALWEEVFFDLLPSSLPKVDRMEVLLSVSSSSSRLKNGERSKVYKDKASKKLNKFSHEPLKGYRTLVYKGPTETRDALTLSIDQSNTVKWIEKQCAELASRMPYSAYGHSDKDFDRILSKFYRSGGIYYNRDLTKEGLTKPRWFLKAIASACKRKYPDNPIWDYFSIYDGLTIVVDGKAHKCVRGHGLGMANALTTLMQIGNFAFFKARYDQLPSDIDALFYNDDATIYCGPAGSDGELTYSELETDELTMLGLIPKEPKTYSSPVMILCERYFHLNLGRKQSYERFIRRIPFASTNIVTAKAAFYMVDDPAFGEIDPNLVDRLISFWGYEYDPHEYSLPAFAGGWVDPKIHGVHLIFMEPLPLTQLFARGVNVGPSQLRPKEFNRLSHEVWEHPIHSVIQLKPEEVRKEVREMFDILQPLSKIAAKFSRNHNDSEMHKFFKNQLIKRYIKWSTPALVPRSIVEVYYKVVKDNPLVDYIPPEQALTRVPLDDIALHMDRIPIVPKQPNKLLGSLSFFSGGKYIRNVIPYPYLPGVEQQLYNDPSRLEKAKESILALPRESYLVPPEVDIEFAGALKQRSYCSDYGVLSAWLSQRPYDLTFPRPQFMSVGGSMMREASRDLLICDYFGKEMWWDLFLEIGRTTTFILMFGLISLEEWDGILRELKILDDDLGPFGIKPDVSEPGEDQVTYDFGLWYSTEGFVPPSGLVDIFEEVRDMIRNAQHIKGSHSLSGERNMDITNVTGPKAPPEGSDADKVYKAVTKVVGQTFQGFYYYSIPDPTDLWAEGNDSDDSGGALGDLFG